jgi:hypothetical protein
MTTQEKNNEIAIMLGWEYISKDKHKYAFENYGWWKKGVYYNKIDARHNSDWIGFDSDLKFDCDYNSMFEALLFITKTYDAAWKMTSKFCEIHNHNNGFCCRCEINCPENPLIDMFECLFQFSQYIKKEITMLNEKEKQLAAHWLDEASNIYGSHGCNDVEEKVWNGWTKEERQLRKFYEANEMGGGSTDWYNNNCRVNKELAELKNLTDLKKQIQEKDSIIYGLEEGCESWKAEYDNCRAILSELVEVKKIKDDKGETIEYLTRQPEAWKAAKEFLMNYQHQTC